jgi:3-isopropylmalate/(R)-2-methylmalate dehydratase small subunit
MEFIRGRVWKYGDDVNTDVIFAGKYTYTIRDPGEMAKHALEDLDPQFAQEVKRNDIIVAGKNWGCGSSREQAVTCLKQKGLGAIIAKSFGRIYYRNCLNAALPALTCPEAVEAIQDKEIIQVDLPAGKIRCEAGIFQFPSLPKTVMEILDAGGLISYTRKQLTAKEAPGRRDGR